MKTGWKVFDEYMCILDALWFIIEPIIEQYSDSRRGSDQAYVRKPGGGRKHKSLRVYLNTIIYVLLSGAQWNAVLANPQCGLAKGNTANGWHIRWSNNGFYEELTIIIAEFYQLVYQYALLWCSADCSSYKAPLALSIFGKNPTDRGKNGCKRSLVVDEKGLPVGFYIAGANQHDSKILAETLEKIFVGALKELAEKHLCLDAAYIGPAVQTILEMYGFEGHVQPRNKEITEKKLIPTLKQDVG